MAAALDEYVWLVVVGAFVAFGFGFGTGNSSHALEHPQPLICPTHVRGLCDFFSAFPDAFRSCCLSGHSNLLQRALSKSRVESNFFAGS